MSVGPDHYSKDHPYIVGKNGVPYVSLTGFTQALSVSPGCGGGMKYQLSTDKSTWKWWNGSTWTPTTNTTTPEANSTTQLTTAGVISTFPGPGTVYFRASLGSDGTQACELDSVTFSGLK